MGALLEGVYRPLVLDLKRQPGRSRHDSKLLTSAYRKFVGGFYSRNHPSRRTFVDVTVPYLVENTCPNTTVILACLWFKKHGTGHKGAFLGEVKKAVFAAGTPKGGLYRRLRTQRQRDALRIAVTLSRLKPDGVFPLPGRELQTRLLLSQPSAARDVLRQMVKLGVLAVVDPGLSRPEASKLGVKARSATYRIAASTEPRS